MLGLRLDQVEKLLTALEAPALRVRPAYCSRLRHQRSGCTLCAEHCPTGALPGTDSLRVDPERCTSCGICATVCPTGVFEAQDPSNLELFARMKELVQAREWVAFACRRSLEAPGDVAERFIQVPCLGRLDESILIGAVSMGMDAVWLMDGACQRCPYAIGRAIVEQVVQRSNALLHAWGVRQRIAIGPHLPPELTEKAQHFGAAAGSSRRAFFSVLTREAARTAAVTVKSIRGDEGPPPGEEAPRKGELPVRLPAKRQLLLAALGQLGRPAGASVQIHGLFAQLAFVETCTGCQMCAFFCPTGALAKVEEDGKAGVAFRAADCVNCGLCRDICYRDAVVLFDSADRNTILDDAAEVILMREAGAVPGLGSPKERTRELLESIYPRNE